MTREVPAPSGVSNLGALNLVVEAIEAAGYRPGEQCCIALDVAASELRHQNAYILIKDRSILSSDELIDMYEEWITQYPIISIEDGMAEDDWKGWTALMERIGDKRADSRRRPVHDQSLPHPAGH